MSYLKIFRPYRKYRLTIIYQEQGYERWKMITKYMSIIFYFFNPSVNDYSWITKELYVFFC